MIGGDIYWTEYELRLKNWEDTLHRASYLVDLIKVAIELHKITYLRIRSLYSLSENYTYESSKYREICDVIIRINYKIYEVGLFFEDYVEPNQQTFNHEEVRWFKEFKDIFDKKIKLTS